MTSAAAASVCLDRRARHVTVRAEHAAVAGAWLQALPAALAVIKELAGIRRHRFGGPVTAERAGQGGLQLHAIVIGQSRLGSKGHCTRRRVFLIPYGPDGRLDGEPIGDERLAVERLQNRAASRAPIITLTTRCRR